MRSPPHLTEEQWRERPIELQVGHARLDFRRDGILRLHIAAACGAQSPGRVQLAVLDDDDELAAELPASIVRLLALRLLAASAENAGYIDAQTSRPDRIGRVRWSDVDTLLGSLWTLGEPDRDRVPGDPAATRTGQPHGSEPFELQVDRLDVELADGVLGLYAEPAEVYEPAHPGLVYVVLAARADPWGVCAVLSASQARLLACRLLAASAEHAFAAEEARYRLEQPLRKRLQAELAELKSDPAGALRAVKRHGFVLSPCDQRALAELESAESRRVEEAERW